MRSVNISQPNIKGLVLQSLVLFLIVLTALSIVDMNLIETAPSNMGKVDLRKADFSNYIYALNGDWRVSTNSHIPVNQSNSYSPVPVLVSSKENTCISVSTTLILNNPDQLLALRIGNVRMAYELYADAQLISKSGQLATFHNKAVSYNVPKVTVFKPKSNTVNLTFIIDNDYYNTTGILEPILIGSPEKINYRQMQLNILDLVLIVGFILSSLYYIVLYIHNPKEKSQLYFAFYAILYAFIVSSGYQKILLQVFPTISFEHLIFTRTIANQLAMLLLCLYYRFLHPKLIGTKLILFIALSQVIQNILYLTIDHQAYWQLDAYFFIVQLALLLYVSIKMIRFISRHYLGLEHGNYHFDIIVLLTMHLCIFFNYFVYMLYNGGHIDSQVAGFSFLVVFLYLNMRLLAIKYTLVNLEVHKINFELEKTLSYRDAFITQTAHDLIVPVENISALAASVIKNQPDIESELKSPLRDLQLLSAQLSQEIRAIISQAHIQLEHTTLNVQALDLLSLIRYCMSLKGIYMPRDFVKVHFGSEQNYYVWADEDKLIQCFLHLLTYQMRWYDKLSFSIDKHDTQTLTLKLGRLSQSMEPISNDTNFAAASNQLELSIVDFLMRQMNGSLYFGPADSNHWRDCYITLPRAFENEVYHAPIHSHSKNNKGLILLVNYNDQNIFALTETLKSAGYGILRCKNGVEALETVSLLKPDIIIIDSILHDMTGAQLSLKLRKNYDLAQLPILLMFYRHFDKEICIGLSCGMNDYLVKPIAVDEALLKIDALMAYKKNTENLVRAEIAFWQSQIKPHFIYNALNVITSLIYQDPEYAAELLAEFGNYLRMSIDIELKEMYIPISKEVSLIKSYIAIETARFGNRLEIMYHIDDSLSTIHIPALLIQPLFENAVKHGVLKRIQGGQVQLYIENRQHSLYVAVEDNGIGMTEDVLSKLLKDENGSGSVGIKNVHKRLQSLYSSSLNIKSIPNEGTLVWFKIPLDSLGGPT